MRARWSRASFCTAHRRAPLAQSLVGNPGIGFAGEFRGARSGAAEATLRHLAADGPTWLRQPEPATSHPPDRAARDRPRPVHLHPPVWAVRERVWEQRDGQLPAKVPVVPRRRTRAHVLADFSACFHSGPSPIRSSGLAPILQIEAIVSRRSGFHTIRSPLAAVRVPVAGAERMPGLSAEVAAEPLADSARRTCDGGDHTAGGECHRPARRRSRRYAELWEHPPLPHADDGSLLPMLGD